ncbi:DUF2929 family protein [Virgibacillus sp. W0430]|uniref:DUF2929 family protein n=1 Tax=Virgibacillus sp. W0430 TaxID=3391580 RepID=UPI003F46AE69
MRYIMTVFWAVLISGVVSYVLSSMASEPFSVSDSLILAAIMAIIIFVLGDGLLKNQEDN